MREKMKILYAEDEPSMREITKEFLEMDGIAVDTACSATEAIEMIDRYRYDAIISDYQMPGMDGIELLRFLRSRSNNMPFVLFTGKGREEIAIQALNTGADHYVQKGGEPTAQFAELVHHIRRAVERRVGEAQLAESREKFRSLVECIGDWRWEMDPSGSFTYSSPQVFDVIGHRPEEIVGRSVLEIVPEAERPRVLTAARERLLMEGKLQRFENTKVHRDGSLVTVESSVVTVVGKKGEVLGFRGVDRDITRERETEKALRDMNYKYQILSSITWHDILNQLSVLNGNVELLRRSDSSGSRETYLNRIEAASDSVKKHIEFTRDYQRTGEREPEWQNVFLSFMMAKAMIDTREVTVECAVSGLEIMADPMLVKTFLNMIDNSLRYGGKVTRIRLSMIVDDDRAVLCYEDDGNGVQDLDRERMFEKGFGRNMGMGMFLTRAILGITGISIQERGRPGEGIKLEMMVPAGRFRFSNKMTLDNILMATPSDRTGQGSCMEWEGGR